MFFFFQQDTAFEVSAWLVGSEEVIRDRGGLEPDEERVLPAWINKIQDKKLSDHSKSLLIDQALNSKTQFSDACPLYNSDADDDQLCLDSVAGGLVQKKKATTYNARDKTAD